GRLADPDAEVITEATGTVVAERVSGRRASRRLGRRRRRHARGWGPERDELLACRGSRAWLTSNEPRASAHSTDSRRPVVSTAVATSPYTIRWASSTSSTVRSGWTVPAARASASG